MTHRTWRTCAAYWIFKFQFVYLKYNTTSLCCLRYMGRNILTQADSDSHTYFRRFNVFNESQQNRFSNVSNANLFSKNSYFACVNLYADGWLPPRDYVIKFRWLWKFVFSSCVGIWSGSAWSKLFWMINVSFFDIKYFLLSLVSSMKMYHLRRWQPHDDPYDVPSANDSWPTCSKQLTMTHCWFVQFAAVFALMRQSTGFHWSFCHASVETRKTEKYF